MTLKRLNNIKERLYICLSSTKKKNNNKELAIYASFIVIVFVFLLNSPLHIWRGTETGTDSSVFKTVALMMQHGFMPYVNTFDHKGPLIYIYNYFGNLIGGYRGVLIFESISLWATLIYLYKIARLKCDSAISYVITILSFSLLFKYFEGGNLTEEYALPFISCSLYIFLDYICNNKVNKGRLILCGLSCGSVLMLRPNMIGTWFIFSFVVLLQCIKNRKYKDLIKFIEYFIIGVLIIFIPIITWLVLNGAIKEFWNAYIVFNGIYSHAAISADSTKFIDIWNSLFEFVNNEIILASIVIIIVSMKKDKKNIIYLIYMICSLLLICLSGRIYLHYMMVFIPIIVYPFSIMFEYFNDNKKKDYGKIATMIVIIYLMSNIIIPVWISPIQQIPKYYYLKNKVNISERVQTITNIIQEKTDKNDKISIYGNSNIYYVLSNRMHATKYSFQFPIGNVIPKIMDEYFEQLKCDKPKIIVVESKMYDTRIKNYIENNNYKLIFGSPNNDEETLVFEHNNLSIKQKNLSTRTRNIKTK